MTQAGDMDADELTWPVAVPQGYAPAPAAPRPRNRGTTAEDLIRAAVADPAPINGGRAEAGESDLEPAADDDPRRPSKCTEVANARRFALQHRANVRYCYDWRAWLSWDGTRWKRDAGAEVRQMAKDTARSIYAEAGNWSKEEQRKAGADWAKKSESAAAIENMLKLAQSEKGIPITPDELDKDPSTLNVGNGVVSLRTGELRPHSRDLLLSNFTRVEYDPGARSALWENFLRDVTGGNRDLANFLQVAAGYSATGHTSEEKLFMPIGPGGTGKTTYLEALKAALGSYAWVADFESFLHRPAGGGGIRSDIAELAGKRFVLSVEVDEAARLAEGLVKHLTGGDTMRARQLYQEGFLFQPQFKLWLAANHAPRARDDDSGLWRRILRIPLDTVVPEDRRDPTLKGRLKQPDECGRAILAWIVEGAIRWAEEGLIVPTCIRAATEAYRVDQDPLKDFFTEALHFDPKTWIIAADLRRAYEHHCQEAGVRYPLGPKQFGERLRARGCEPELRKIDSKPTRIWVGVEVIS